MAAELFEPQLIIARLRDQVAALRKVAGAADFAAATPDLKQTPAAFVIELANSADGDVSDALAVMQMNRVRFGVLLAVQNLRDTTGEKAHADLRTLREAVMTALLGWEPDPDYDVIKYAGGRLLSLDNLVLWWQDDYITAIYERSI